MLGQSRRTQRYVPKPDPEEDNLTAEIRTLSLKHPRYGYKRITACLKRSGWKLNRKRVLRIWRAQGLKVPIRKRQEVAPVALRTGAPRGLWPITATTSGATISPIETHRGRPAACGS